MKIPTNNIKTNSNNINLDQEILLLKGKLSLIKKESKCLKEEINILKKEYNELHKEYKEITSKIIYNENTYEEINNNINLIIFKETKILLDINNIKEEDVQSLINNNNQINNLLNCFLLNNTKDKIFHNKNELLQLLDNFRKYFICDDGDNNKLNNNYQIINKEINDIYKNNNLNNNNSIIILQYIESVCYELKFCTQKNILLKENEELNNNKNKSFILMKNKEKDINEKYENYNNKMAIKNYIKIILENYAIYNTKENEYDKMLLKKEIINQIIIFKQGKIPKSIKKNKKDEDQISLDIKSEYNDISNIDDSLMNNSKCLSNSFISKEEIENINKDSIINAIYKRDINYSRNNNELLSTEQNSNNLNINCVKFCNDKNQTKKLIMNENENNNSINILDNNLNYNLAYDQVKKTRMKFLKKQGSDLNSDNTSCNIKKKPLV